jgi:hypothetical protein
MDPGYREWKCEEMGRNKMVHPGTGRCRAEGKERKHCGKIEEIRDMSINDAMRAL